MPPILEVKNLYRKFPSGDDEVTILKDINLTIEAGELVAIMGQSGSGKTTLMNILGCLDRPSSGSYKVHGKATDEMDPDELSKLRREHFGFIFQRYHLLSDLDALGNVEVPSIYANYTFEERVERASKLLTRLGLGDRMNHKPNQLSGGQQQRVSIARALMNGGEIILADEPTGALDSRSGQEVIEILKELHADGHTIIIVTHDMNVANTAHRIIEIKDGEIISDKRIIKEELKAKAIAKNDMTSKHPWQGAIDRFSEAFGMAFKSMLAHRMRTFLTMLGIIIGIASVVSVIALGEGSRQKILKDISNMGTNTINIYPGKGFGDRDARKIHTLTVADAEILKKQDFIDSVTPSVNDSVTVRYKNISVDAQIKGVGEDFFQVRGIEVDKGMMFDSKLVGEYAQVAVIDPNAQKELFGQDVNPVGQTIMLGSVPVRIIGLSKKLSSAFMGADSINIWVPYTTVMSRMLGQSHLNSITVRVSDDVTSTAAEEGINKILEQRHRTKDFYMANLDSIRQTIESTTATMRLLISMIAAIALVVGGIGVMNIMLVSVTERTSEIGVRMAVGARQSDIMQQFLIESVVVCLFGGVLGIGLALLIGEIFGQMSSMFSMIFSIGSIIFAFVCSTLIGVVFGFIPAKNAAKLDPVVALSRE